MTDKEKLRSGAVVLGCFLLYGTVAGAFINTRGLFIAPVSKALGVGIGSFSLCSSITSLASMFLLPFAGRILDSRFFKQALLGAVVVFSLSLVGMTCCDSLWQCYVLSVIHGVCYAFASPLMVQIMIGAWFTGGAGLMLSLALCASGIFSAVLSPVLASLIETFSWKAGYLFLAGLILAVGTFSVLFLLKQPAHKQEDASALSQKAEKKVRNREMDTGKNAVPYKMKLALLCLFMLGPACAVTIGTHMSNIAVSFGAAASTAALANSALMVGNMGFKLVCGVAVDRIGWKRTTLIGLLLNIGGYGLLMLGGNTVLNLGAALCGIAYSMYTITPPQIVRAMFPQNEYGKILGIINMLGTVVTAGFTSIAGFLFDFTGDYRLSIALYIFTLATAWAAVIMLTKNATNNGRQSSPGRKGLCPCCRRSKSGI